MSVVAGRIFQVLFLFSFTNKGAGLMTVFAPEHLRAAYQTGVQTFFALANPALQGVQAVADLNVRTVKAALAESEATFKGAIQSQNPAEFFAQQVTVSQQAAAKAISYGQQLADIATQAHAEWTKVAGTTAEAMRRGFEV
jgi:phasin family protein